MEIYTILLDNVTPVKLVTAKASYGIGFLTSFVSGFCSLLGIPNDMYTEKIKKAEALAMQELERKVKSIGADGVMDVRCQIDGLSFLITGTAYKWSKEEKAKREAEEKAQREAEEKAQCEAEEKPQREAEEKAQREAEEKEKREVEKFLDGLPYMPKPIGFETNADWEKNVKKLSYQKLRSRYLDIGNYSDTYRYICYLEIINRNKQ